MKLRVQYFKKTQGNKTFLYPWIGYSYRTEKGTPSFKRITSLTGYPQEAVDAIARSLSSPGTSKISSSDVQFLQSVSIGAEAVALEFADKLGICKALECLSPLDRKIILSMIIDRVTQSFPHSRKSLFENLPGSGLAKVCSLDNEELKLENMYYALEHLCPLQNQIELELFQKHHPNKARMFLYDITSCYFEGNSCELEEFGYNRDHKDGKKQIVIGLIADDERCPISVEVFKGNTSDQSTVMSRIDSLRTNFGINEMVFVGDRGMLTKARRDELDNKEYEKVKYISALTHAEFERFLVDDAHPLQLSLFDRSKLATVEKDGVKFVLSFNPELEERTRTERNRLLEKTEEHLRAIERSVACGRLRNELKISARLFRHLNKWNCEKFFLYEIAEGRFSWTRNEKMIKSYEATDGFYVFSSNAIDMQGEDIREEYRKLQKIEQAFRTMKTADIFMRPIRLWNTERVRAHILVCMLSYMVIWYARKKFQSLLKPDEDQRVSLRFLWEQLGKIQIGKIRIGDEIHEHLSNPDIQIKKILSEAGMTTGQLAKKYQGNVVRNF